MNQGLREDTKTSLRFSKRNPNTCLEELGENICHSEDVLASCKPWELLDGLPSDLDKGKHTNTEGFVRTATDNYKAAGLR